MKKIYDLKKRSKKMEIKKFNTVFIIGLFLVLAQSVFAATTLTRDLPSAAAAGSTFTVTLALDVEGTLVGGGITERFPSGWTVSSISNGGKLNTSASTIEWVLFDMGAPLTDLTRTYQITAPSSASGSAAFSGTLLLNATNSINIIGDTSVSITGSATSTTTTTTLPPYDAYATRSMVSSIRSGATLTVSLILSVDETKNLPSVGVSEVIPEGWTVTSISNNGTYFATGHKIEWVFWSGGITVADRTLTYTVLVPSGTTGTKTFSGTVDYGATTNPAIYGRNQITVSKKSNSNDEFIVTLPAQSYTNSAVEIKVVDSDSKKAVSKAGVDVFIGSSNSGKKVAYGMTNANGTFTFTPAEAGTYTVYVDMSSYKEAKETLTVKSGAPTTAPTTTVVATTQKVTTIPFATTTLEPVVTTQKPTTTAPITTQAPVTTMPPETSTTMEEVTDTTEPSTGGDSGSNMLLIGVIVIIIIAAVVFFMMKGKKGKPAENGKKGKEEKASKPSEAKE
jgi:LPXTG-motif cell wall-anchored protein